MHRCAVLAVVFLPACFASHEAADASGRDGGAPDFAVPDLGRPPDLGTDLGTDFGPPPDLGRDGGPATCTPGGTVGRPCSIDDDCDDGCFCTSPPVCAAGRCAAGTARVCPEDTVCSVTTCNEATDMCEGTRNDAICDDHEFCNGLEWCLPFGGCRPGVPPACDDGDACTVDFCTPGGVGCGHGARDDDSDGFGPRDCMGTDCNDLDPTVHPGAVDVCDGIDADCAENWDYDVPGCTSPFDTCETAGEIDMGAVVSYYEGTTLANHDDYGLSCGAGGVDAVYHLVNPSLHVFEIAVFFVGVHAGPPDERVGLAIRPWADCAAGPDRRCASGPPPMATQPGAIMPITLAAGEYAIILEAPTRASYSLRVSR